MLQKIENQQSGGKGSRFTASPGTRIAGIKTIADLVSYVKQYDERYKPNASSRVVDEDGKPLAEIVSRGFENAKANEAEYGSLESGVRYSKEDILDKFGIEERKLSDYIYVQRKVFDTLKSEGFFTEFDKSNNRYYRIDKNIETGIEVETNKSGINETFNYLNYASKGKNLRLTN